MKYRLEFALLVGICSLLSLVSIRAQPRVIIEGGKCQGKTYSSKEVTRRARVLQGPDFSITREAAEHNVHGTIVIRAILCHTGHVTDIEVIKELPFGLTQRAIEAVGNLRFAPAELNWHTVSQRMEFQFSVNDDGVESIDPSAATGRLVEELDIMGNRRMTKEQILPMIKTRPGDIFNQDQVQRDLTAILATGNFNPIGTRVLLEDALRGGVRVIFEVFELPLIRRLWFRGVTAEDEFAIMEELVKPQLNIRIGAPSHPVKLRAATEAIKQYFQSKGWSSVNVETLIENLSATEVNITFMVSGLKPKL